jgi:class 3 adenylate cyclase
MDGQIDGNADGTIDEGADDLARVLAFPMGRRGTRRRRRRDAPASQPVRSAFGAERRLTTVRGAICVAPCRAADAPRDDHARALLGAAHEVIATMLVAGAGEIALEGSAWRPVVVGTFEGAEHAAGALAAALDVAAKVARPSRAPRLEIRIGIHTASVMDLVVGGHDPLPFRAVGTLYALAERLEEAADAGQVLLSADTLGDVGEIATVAPRGALELNGHGEVRDVYALVELRADGA